MNRNPSSIEDVRAAVVPVSLDEPFAAGRWILDAVYNVVVEVRDAENGFGLGYAFVFTPDDARTIAAAANALRPFLIGRDPFDTRALQADLRAATNFVGSGGAAQSAVGAVDLALWDLKGKRLATPVHTLLGSTRTRVAAYASGGPASKSFEALEREVKDYLAWGFTAIKVKLPVDPSEACRRIAACRGWVGPDIKMMYDSNQQQSFKDALRIGRCAADYDAYWYEEPFPYWQLDRSAEIRRQLDCRLALGETLYGTPPFYDAVKVGAADVLMPNLHKIGGVSGWVTIAGLADLAGVPLSSHTMPEVSAQVMAATPGAELLEYMDWWRPLYDRPFDVEDGYLVLAPDEPGLGLSPSATVRAALERE